MLDHLDPVTGQITEYAPPLQPIAFTIAADGAIWFDTFYEGKSPNKMEIHRLPVAAR
jgi:hypothetical protein